jgi:hypothetical protein
MLTLHSTPLHTTVMRVSIKQKTPRPFLNPKGNQRTPISIQPPAIPDEVYEKRSKTTKSKTKVHKNDRSLSLPHQRQQPLPPSSLIPPADRPLRTPLSRQYRANPNRRPHSRISRRALDRHAPPSSHGSRSAALNDRRSPRAQHAARAVFLVAPHHPSRMAGGENALATGAARGRRRSGGRRAGAVDGGFALAGDVDVCA